MSQRRRIVRLVLLALLLALVACRNRRTAEPTPTPPATPRVQPTSTQSPALTETPATPRIQPTSTQSPAPTETPAAQGAAINLVPFVDENFSLQGLIPEGWTRLQPGTYVRGQPPDSQAGVIVAAYAHAPQGWGPYFVQRLLGLAEFPAGSGSRTTPSLDWTLYAMKGKDANGRTWNYDLAMASVGPAVYIAFLQASPAEYPVLHQSVFLAVLDALQPVPVETRDKLTSAELKAAASPAGPVHNDYFAPLGTHAAARAPLEGTLNVPAFTWSFASIVGAKPNTGQERFPGFSTQFFTYEDHLVPIQQDILPALDNQSYWQIIVSPGRVWSEAADGGLSRAAFPFVVVTAGGGEAHNGLATFLYDESQVSQLRVQVIQETSTWNQFDAWGQGAMSYTAGAVKDRDALAARFADELAHDLAVRPWSDLEGQHDTRLLAAYTGAVDLLDISATGLIHGDTMYLQPCYTRYGEFPFCENMRHGVFSVTKSLGAAVALLHLAQVYGEGVFDQRLTDYVTLSAAHDGWQGVTFGDALNMATGIGDDPSPVVADMTAEESQPKFQRFTSAKSTQEKLDVISTYGKYPWGPGTVARYNSTNTFVLSVAMDRYLKSKEGPQADLWDWVLEGVYRRIGIGQAPILRTVEPDGSRGVPILGYGLYPTVQEMAKVALLVQNGGQHEGQQLLHPGKLAEAMENIEEAGLYSSESNALGEGRYHESIWAMPSRSAKGTRRMIPYMTGFGGNRVVFCPNRWIAFRFTDAANYELAHLVKGAEAVEPW